MRQLQLSWITISALLFEVSVAFVTDACSYCRVSTLPETTYSGYVYHSRPEAKQACLDEYDKCGSVLTPGRDDCIRRQYGPLCMSEMQNQPTKHYFHNLPQRCFFTEAQLSQCIAAAGLWEQHKRECYTEQSGGYYQYIAPGYTEHVLGFCSGWTCENCEYNRVACQNRVFCEMNPILPITASPSLVSHYTRYCPRPQQLIPPNEAYFQQIRQYRGNIFVEEGSEVDCVNEYLGCHIPCTVDPSTPKGVNYARCLTDCICEQVTLVPCMGFSNIIHANWQPTVREENLSDAKDEGKMEKAWRIETENDTDKELPSVSRQFAASINVPSCLQRCSYWLHS